MHPTIKRVAKPIFRAVRPIIPAPFLLWFKGYSEMRFWKGLYGEERKLDNDHYEYFYTDFFALERDWYKGKTLLDVGCGPAGSLEWADMAGTRTGLDPLVDQYRTLGIDKHKMDYVCAPVEKIPFATGSRDVVCSFNSLDHVDHLDTAIGEIFRVLKVGGSFLIIVEVNHKARPTEPIEIWEDALRQTLSRYGSIASWRAFPIRYDHDIYRSLREGSPIERMPDGKEGLIAAQIIKGA